MTANRKLRRQKSHPLIRESAAVPAGQGATDTPEIPRECHEAFQIKYDIDERSPQWKRLFFHWIYLPFVRFAFFKVGIIPPTLVRCSRCGEIPKNGKGQLGVREIQGVFFERWQAENEASKYPFGGVERVALNCSEPSSTCAPRSLFPNSTASDKYERAALRTIPVPESSLERLDRMILEAKPTVEHYRTRSAKA